MEQTKRRRVLAGLAAAGSFALAGCSSGDSGDDDGGTASDGSDDGSTASDGSDDGSTTSDGSDDGTEAESADGGSGGDGGSEIESMCQPADVDPSGLAVTTCQSEVEGKTLAVSLTITNEGDESVNLFSYPLQVQAYNSTDTTPQNRLSGSTEVTYMGRATSVGPDSSIDVAVDITPNDGTGADVERYTVGVTCGSGAGAYCDSDSTVE